MGNNSLAWIKSVYKALDKNSLTNHTVNGDPISVGLAEKALHCCLEIEEAKMKWMAV